MSDYIKWTHEDGFEVGQTVSLSIGEDRTITFSNAKGLFEVPLSDGKFEEISKETFIQLNHGETPVRDVPTKDTTPKPKSVKSGSKKEQAIALYKANSGMSRKELIELFIRELGMTPAGASTYVHLAKNG